MSSSDARSNPGHRPEEEPIAGEAMHWFLRRQGARADADQEAEFQAWLARDPSCAGAYARIESLWQDPAFMAAVARQADRTSHAANPVVSRVTPTRSIPAVLPSTNIGTVCA